MPMNLTRTEWSIVMACLVSVLCGFFVGYISSEHTYPVPIRTVIEKPVPVYQELPHCEEDETYLRGYGNFEDGHYETYVCVHPDQIPTEQQVVDVICSHPEEWYVEVTACRD